LRHGLRAVSGARLLWGSVPGGLLRSGGAGAVGGAVSVLLVGVVAGRARLAGRRCRPPGLVGGGAWACAVVGEATQDRVGTVGAGGLALGACGDVDVGL